MKKYSIKNLFYWMPCLLLCAASIITSCDNDDIDGSIIKIPDTELWDTTAIGKYINKEFTDPFNIRIIYKWEDGRNDVSKYLVPVKEEKVIPFLSLLKRIWADPYVKITTESGHPEFLRTYVPKEMILTGSENVNSDGTKVLGFAEGGRQIFLFNINNLTPKDSADFVMFMHTMHHEFAHILQQANKSYDTKFRAISKGDYTASWMNITDEEAREKGFITAYAQAEVDEDFVEMISMMLIRNAEEWEALKNSIRSEESRNKIKLKEDIMKDYMSSVWDIDMEKFQTMVSSSIVEVINEYKDKD